MPSLSRPLPFSPTWVTLLLHCSWSCFLERECRTHPSPHGGLQWGFSLLSARSWLGLSSVPATCGRGEWEMNTNRKPCRKEPVQSKERNPQSILEKQKRNTRTCVVPYCSLLGTFHLLPACQSSSIWLEGHKRGAYPFKAHFSSLCTGNCHNSWATFSPFSRARAAAVPSDTCVLQAQGLLCHSLVKATCLGRLLWPEHTQLSPTAPAPALRGRNQPRCSQEDPRTYLSWRTGALARVM